MDNIGQQIVSDNSTVDQAAPVSNTAYQVASYSNCGQDWAAGSTIYEICKVQDILDGVQDFLDPVQVFLDGGSKISWTGVQVFLDGVQEILDRVFQKCA